MCATAALNPNASNWGGKGGLPGLLYTFIFSGCDANSLTDIDEIGIISSPVQIHGICGRRYFDPTKLIFVIVKL
jgi:hypothetical protein